MATGDGKAGLEMKLQAQQLAYGYPERRIGSDVTFELDAGEVLCLLGPNGGGKTTLFKTLLGLLPVQGGEVILDGQDLTTLKRDEIARRVSYVPQAHGAFFPYTVREVVLMGRTAHGQRASCRCHIHAHLRGRTSAGADRASLGAAGAHGGDGRTDRQS